MKISDLKMLIAEITDIRGDCDDIEVKCVNVDSSGVVVETTFSAALLVAPGDGGFELHMIASDTDISQNIKEILLGTDNQISADSNMSHAGHTLH